MKDVGVKVLIDAKDEKGNKICDYGYITRRINAQVYEIWSESYQTVFLLHPEEFTEVSKD